ncbi:fecCD transport family protein, partial [Vibrio cholerae HE-46]
ALVYDSFDYAQ